jgi:ABC-type Co2+ transport system permease subunit
MTLKSSNRSLRSAGHAAASSRWLVRLARGGLVARGVNYVLIGVLAALRLARVSGRTRKVVETVGVVGTSARGIVLGLVGVFLVAAAVAFDPKKAQGFDGVLRKIATTPLGPWLLVAVAAGLVTFGVYSCCEARWRNVQPG